jgi:hypothetical protein
MKTAGQFMKCVPSKLTLSIIMQNRQTKMKLRVNGGGFTVTF